VCERLDDVIARGELEVPALGEAVAQLLVETRKPDTDARRVAEIIRRDAALAGNLMKLANSSAYAGREPAVTLQQVVTRVGTTALRDLALVIATRTRAFRVAGHEQEMRDLFAHAFATGLYAQEVARTRRLGVEEAFLAGLFHDVGRPLVLQLVIDLYAEVGEPVDDRVLAWAADALHADIGARAVETWQLGKNLADAVRYHHDFGRDTARRPAALAAFASALARYALAGGTGTAVGTGDTTDADLDDPVVVAQLEAEIAVREHPAVTALGVYPDDVVRFLQAAPKVVKQVAEAL
jgi:HD-like signal output (HDOD) protein